MLFDPKKWAMPEVPVRESETVETLKAARAMIGVDGACIIEALAMVTVFQSTEYESARKYMRRAIALSECESLPEWHDAPGRTRAQVIAAFDRAIALARAND
jgi:hypothetical protein